MLKTHRSPSQTSAAIVRCIPVFRHQSSLPEIAKWAQHLEFAQAWSFEPPAEGDNTEQFEALASTPADLSAALLRVMFRRGEPVRVQDAWQEAQRDERRRLAFLAGVEVMEIANADLNASSPELDPKGEGPWSSTGIDPSEGAP